MALSLEEVATLYNMGYPLRKLAEMYGVSAATIYYYLRAAEKKGIKVQWRRRSAKKLRREEKAAIRELCKNMPKYRIARMFHVHYTTVYRLCS